MIFFINLYIIIIKKLAKHESNYLKKFQISEITYSPHPFSHVDARLMSLTLTFWIKKSSSVVPSEQNYSVNAISSGISIYSYLNSYFKQ